MLPKLLWNYLTYPLFKSYPSLCSNCIKYFSSCHEEKYWLPHPQNLQPQFLFGCLSCNFPTVWKTELARIYLKKKANNNNNNKKTHNKKKKTQKNNDPNKKKAQQPSCQYFPVLTHLKKIFIFGWSVSSCPQWFIHSIFQNGRKPCVSGFSLSNMPDSAWHCLIGQ